MIEESWKTLSDRVKIPESDRDSFRSVWWDWEPTGQDWLTPSLLPSFFLPLSFNFSSFAAYSIFRWSHVFNVRLTRFSLDKSLFLPHLLQGIYNNNTTLLLQTSCKKFESSKVHELKKNTNFRYLSIGNLSPSSAAALLQQLDTLWCFSSYIVSLFQLGCDCPKGRIFTGLHNSPMYLQSIAELSSVSLVEDHNLHTLFQSGCDCARGKI